MPLRTTHRSRLIRLLVILSLCGTAGVLYKLTTGVPDGEPALDAADTLYRQAQLAIDSEQYARARDLLQKCLQQNPKHVSARLYYGQLLREAGQTDEALEIWQSIREGTSQERSTARFLQGSVAIERQRVDRSRDLLEEAVQLNPRYLAAWEKLLNVYRMQRDSAKVAETLQHIAEFRELSKNELITRTVLNEYSYSLDESLDVLRHSLHENPGDLAVRRGLAAVYLERSEPENVFEIVTRAESAAKTDVELRASAVLAHLELGDLDSAAAACEGSHDSDTDSARWNYACGRVAFEKKDWQTAARHMKQAFRVNPDHQQNCYYFGHALKRLGQPEPAQQFLERAVHLDNVNRLALRLTRETDSAPQQAVPLMVELAGELARLDRYGLAAQWYGLAAELDPGNTQIDSLRRHALNSATGESASADLPDAMVPDQTPDKTPQTGDDPWADPDSTDKRQVPQIEFVDVHEMAGLEHTYFNGQSGFYYLIESMGGGVIVIDYDGDGWDDLYFPQGCRLPVDPQSQEFTDRLFRNLRGESFQDVTHSAGLGSNRYGLGGTALDYDNDGDQDLFVSNSGANQFYQNNGDGTFSEASHILDTDADEMSTSVAAADFNNDGFLDLYVANYLEGFKVCRRADGSYAPCDPGNFRGQMDRLLINDGAGHFSDQSESAGLDVPDSKGLGVIAGDFDRDGRIDLYVANDGVPNFLWKNLTAAGSATVEFQETGLLSGTALDEQGRSQAGMGLTMADFNRDGRPDLYVTNFFKEHNTLYLNRGDNWFVDRTKATGLFGPTIPFLGFGTVARDFNGDGSSDLLVANGHIYRDDSGQQPWKMSAQVFANRWRGVFQDQTLEAGEYFAQQSLGRGVAVFDWNRDGRYDAVIVHQDRPAALLENRGTLGFATISVSLVGTVSNRNAIGAEIRNLGAELETYYWITDGGYLGTHSRTLLITFPPVDREVSLEIRWPSGIKTEHTLHTDGSNGPPSLKQHWILTETGQAIPHPMGIAGRAN